MIQIVTIQIQAGMMIMNGLKMFLLQLIKENLFFLEHENKNSSVGLHVIVNNVGSLLRRRTTKSKSTRHQKNFLQKIVSSAPGTCVPLIYPEGMLFPSIFWCDNRSNDHQSVLGAIPCGLLTEEKHLKNFGFASLSSHIKSRINNTSLKTSTDEKYISYAFDCIVNLECRNNDTRVILHRGVDSCGLHPKTKKENDHSLFDSDGVDCRPVVNKLAAAVAQEQATYFYTHTCNQLDHFGIKPIKEWIDSDEMAELLLKKLNDFGKFGYHNEFETRKELVESMARSVAVALFRNWMIVSEVWMRYISKSKEQPLGKVSNIWYRHEFQDSEGNLSHIHALIWIENESETQDITLNRIRGSILELITPDEIQEFQREGLISHESDIIMIKGKAEIILKHICDKRCKMRKGIEDGLLQCRVENNGIENNTPYRHAFQNIYVKHSKNAMEILKKLDLYKFDNSSGSLEPLEDKLKAQKHYPRATAAEGKISPCNGKMFLLTLSSQNLKYVTGYLASRYLAKYVASIDQNNRIYFNSDGKSSNVVNVEINFCTTQK
jgi:hypothetical protein